jgi:hydrogenase maturation protease
VLGLGNLLLGDDAAGLRLLEILSGESDCGDAVDFVDGGTQGLALLGYLNDRDAVLVLDAMALGDAPGTVHVLRGLEGEQLQARRAGTAHESSAMELFETAKILGGAWAEVVLVGIESKSLRTGIGLSPEVEAALDEAAAKARAVLRGMVESHVLSNTR